MACQVKKTAMCDGRLANRFIFWILNFHLNFESDIYCSPYFGLCYCHRFVLVTCGNLKQVCLIEYCLFHNECYLSFVRLWELAPNDTSVSLAFHRPAWQSSTPAFASVLGLANHSVYGNKKTHLSDGSCSHTDNEHNPWWAVDLGIADNGCGNV